jgi:hypothetical protein
VGFENPTEVEQVSVGLPVGRTSLFITEIQEAMSNLLKFDIIRKDFREPEEV